MLDFRSHEPLETGTPLPVELPVVENEADIIILEQYKRIQATQKFIDNLLSLDHSRADVRGKAAEMAGTDVDEVAQYEIDWQAKKIRSEMHNLFTNWPREDDGLGAPLPVEIIFSDNIRIQDKRGLWQDGPARRFITTGGCLLGDDGRYYFGNGEFYTVINDLTQVQIIPAESPEQQLGFVALS